MTDRLIETIAKRENICNYIHLPVQSGTYDRDHYVGLVERIRRTIPKVSLSTDIIAGFPTETEEDHKMTIDLMKAMRFDGAFMFKYSPREGTKAFSMGDDVPDETKTRRLNDIFDVQHRISYENNKVLIGKTENVLVEGVSKRSKEQYTGKTDTNRTVVFPKKDAKIGDLVNVGISRVTSATLFGEITSQ
jgi:tRNA-2-methylthio-N6-dimethylallyladenosine synthase